MQMKENNTISNVTRRKAMEKVAATGFSIAGFSAIGGASTERRNTIGTRADTSPEWQDSSIDDVTVCGPDRCAYGEHTYIAHTMTVQYYGTVPREDPNGDFKYGHVYRVAGRGKSGGYNTNQNETKEDAGNSPHLTGHAINIKNFGEEVWTPDSDQSQGKLGAKPAEQNNSMDKTERAENILETLVGAAPGIGTVKDADQLAKNLWVDDSTTVNRDFEWQLDSIAGINYEVTSGTSHHVEFEVRVEPGVDIDGQAVSISFLGDKLAAESPTGTLFNLQATTPDKSASSLQEANDAGLNAQSMTATQSIDDSPINLGSGPADFRIIPDSYDHSAEPFHE
ncbi:hypothetical protein [Halorussus pelagicus]|uniref:hypothetical protein n=1 Tax=Halorussus pelagicus TaxID=2505977 RepID=UPI000FFBF14A|nr:hypothetical protein [Halorussus pelagicus]